MLQESSHRTTGGNWEEERTLPTSKAIMVVIND